MFTFSNDIKKDNICIETHEYSSMLSKTQLMERKNK